MKRQISLLLAALLLLTLLVGCGGSGCGCSASVLCGYFLDKVKSGELKNILFCATGALMSPTLSQQGESIPGISHAVHISYEG